MSDDEQRIISLIADGESGRHDIFIGLVAPLGSSREQVVQAFTAELAQYGYSTQLIHLAGLLKSLDVWDDPLPERASGEYYKKHMDAGDRLRREARDWSALAALAVVSVAKRRRESRAKAAADTAPTAYLFSSLKHPQEGRLLRQIYGTAYWQVSIVEDSEERILNLAREQSKAANRFGIGDRTAAQILIDRDEADPDARYGQNVRDVFAQADFFLPVNRGVQWKSNVTRFIAGVFDSPFISPTADEEAMRFARAAALRSAAVSRQVGAAIVPPHGSPIVVGTNEVPRPGGGQFREGDVPDYRDFMVGGDPNPAYTESVIRELIGRLARDGYFTSSWTERGGDAILEEAKKPGPDGISTLDGTRAKALIEFTRCLHAEQAAIVEAARTGTAIQNSRLYTTTFPCHECTKFIIGAGVVELQYIEPYPKSLAGDMYADLVDARPPAELPAPARNRPSKIPFRPFIGFGPSRYDEVFIAGQRREGSSPRIHNPSEATPVGDGWREAAVRLAEDTIAVAVLATTEQLARQARGEHQPPETAADIEPSNDEATGRRVKRVRAGTRPATGGDR